MRMVRASVAGTLHTTNPNHPESRRMLLGVTRGLADRAAGGGARLSTYELSREPPCEVLDYRAAKNTEMVVGRPEGGVAEVAVGPDCGGAAELTAPEAQALARVGLRIERYFKQAQEIEWARDADGTLYVLQTRRLQVARTAEPRTNLPEILGRHRVLMRGQGHVACRGVSCGRVQRLTDLTDLSAVASGVVLIARRGSPRFVCVMPRVAAILTDIGAPTGHMAALAREFRVPTVVDCGDVTRRLGDGQEVTVDADDNVVYEGRVEALLQHQLVEETDFEDAEEYRSLRRLLRRVTPLQLVDPHSDDFRAERCRSVHDVIRLAHEKAVEELIGLHAKGTISGAESARRIDSGLPLNLRVIDIGKGLDAAVASLPAGASIKPESLRSAPMLALWTGLSTPGVWNTEPVGVNWRTLMASATSATVNRSTGRNLAVVSDSYVNLSLNLGYHYNMVDALLCDDREANHVYFRFVGGASDSERRTRRAMVVREILEQLDFSARQSADLVVARLRKLPRAETESRLQAIGRLIGFARQIDALMHSEAMAAHFVDAFLRGDYTLAQ
jgi:pyruvate,water dikinase